jgi:DNA-binding LacI/PurR family transcriptional regulator
LPVTFLSPYPVVHRLTLLELEETRLRLEAQGRALHFVSPNIFHLKNPDRQLRTLVRDKASAAWLLYIAGESVQRWFADQGIPALVFGSPFPGIDLPYITDDWGATAYHAGLQLARQGHRCIGILEFYERFPGLVAEEQGLERALAGVNPPGRVLAFMDDRSPASVAQSLEQAFSLPERPTALVLSRAAQVLTCLSWLASRGLRVPDDISLVSLANDSWFEDLHPPIAHYRSDSKDLSRQIAQRVLELADGGLPSSKSLMTQREYVPGATIGPPPARPALRA